MNATTDTTSELVSVVEARTLTNALAVLEAVADRSSGGTWKLDGLQGYRRGKVNEAVERAKSELWNALLAIAINGDSVNAREAVDAELADPEDAGHSKGVES